MAKLPNRVPLGRWTFSIASLFCFLLHIMNNCWWSLQRFRSHKHRSVHTITSYLPWDWDFDQHYHKHALCLAAYLTVSQWEHLLLTVTLWRETMASKQRTVFFRFRCIKPWKSLTWLSKTQRLSDGEKAATAETERAWSHMGETLCGGVAKLDLKSIGLNIP